jgi:hypothetical protein
MPRATTRSGSDLPHPSPLDFELPGVCLLRLWTTSPSTRGWQRRQRICAPSQDAYLLATAGFRKRPEAKQPPHAGRQRTDGPRKRRPVAALAAKHRLGLTSSPSEPPDAALLHAINITPTMPHRQSTTSFRVASNVRVERQIADGAAGGKLSARTRGWAPGSGMQHSLPATRPLPLGFARTLTARGLPGNYALAGQTHALATTADSLAQHHRPSAACGPANSASGGCPEGTGEPRK